MPGPSTGFKHCSLDGAKLAESLVGCVLQADLHPRRSLSLKWEMLRADDFILPPLPNTLFTRDNSCWMYGGLTVNPMAMPARQRETLHSRAIYRFHPLFAGGDFVTYYGGEDRDYQPAHLEVRRDPQHHQAWLESQIRKLHPGCTITISPPPDPPRTPP